MSSTLPTNSPSDSDINAPKSTPHQASEGELAEQRHLVDERDHDFEALAPNTGSAA